MKPFYYLAQTRNVFDKTEIYDLIDTPVKRKVAILCRTQSSIDANVPYSKQEWYYKCTYCQYISFTNKFFNTLTNTKRHYKRNHHTD